MAQERTAEEYYSRIVRLKPIIEADKDLCDRLRNCFENVYGCEGLRSDILKVGSGTMHTFFSVGNVSGGSGIEKMDLGLRLPHKYPHEFFEGISSCDQDLGAFVWAFMHGENPPPDFVGAVTYVLEKRHIERRVVGILTQDLSEGRRFTLNSYPDENWGIKRKDEENKKYFIDPVLGDPCEDGEKYLADEARIDL